MRSMHLSVNSSRLTTLDTTELTARWRFFVLIEYPPGTSVFCRVIMFAFDQVRPFRCAARGQ